MISEREYREIWRRALVEVDVLADLLALAVRSNAPVSPASARLEADVEAIPGRFGALMAPLLTRARARKTKPRPGSSAVRPSRPAAIPNRRG